MQTRLLLLLLLVAVPALGLLLVTNLDRRREAILHARQDAIHTAQALAAAHDRWIAAAHDLLLVLAQLPAVRQDTAACNNLLPQLFTSFERYAGASVATPDGTVVCSSLPMSESLNIADRPYFQRVLQTQRFTVGEYRIGPVSQKPILPLALPVLDEARGTVQAVVTVGLGLDWFHAVFASQDLPAGATVTLVDRQDTVLARKPEIALWVGRPLPEGERYTALLAAQGASHMEATGLDGVRRVYAFVPLMTQDDSPDGYLSVSIPKAMIVAPAEQSFRWHLWLLSVTIVGAFGMAWVTAEWLVRRPTQDLLHATQRVGAGDLEMRNGPPYPAGELGQLATAFDQMIAQLHAANIELKQEVVARTQAEERIRDLMEGAPDALVIVNAEGYVVLVNAQAERLFGYNRAELLGQSVDLLLPERLRSRHVHHRAHYGSAPTLRPMTTGRGLLGRRKDGSEFAVEISLSPLFTPQGLLVMSAMRDITMRVQLEETLTRQTHELARSNAELERFAYVASHDLQEPLRKVTNYTQLFVKRYAGHLDARADKYLDYIQDGTIRMQNLIQDLLTYSRLGRAEVATEMVDMNEMLCTILATLEMSLADTQAEVTVGALPTIQANPMQMAQLLQNLLGNALKFRGAPPLCIHVAAEATPTGWVFSVRDNGIGLEPQYAERIFLLFQRLHTRAAYAGTGIGLAICKKIVERHGGRIWVESQPGHGATFYFTLPRATADAAPGEGDVDHTERSKACAKALSQCS